jgi:hypothetical protein
MDVEGGIRAGQDFVRVLEQEVSACDVMLVLIGPDWLAAADEQGRRRLENPGDFVRIEVESALWLGKRVIPVLVQRAEMPRADALPESLKPLARRHAVGLTPERFKADAQGLIQALEGVLADVGAVGGRVATEAAAGPKEQARLDAIAGLPRQHIAKPEELANWDFVKTSESTDDLRDHLARFPQGLTKRMARRRLEALVWSELPRPADGDALRGFLEEFVDGAHAGEANAKLAELEAQAAAAREAAERKKREMEAQAVAERKAAERKKREMDAWAAANVAGTVGAQRFSERLASERICQRGARAHQESAERSIDRQIRRAYRSGRIGRVSPDGRSALSGSSDNTLKLWDVATGKEIRSFVGHADRVWSVAFSPDGRTALSGSQDKTLKLWDVAAGKEIRSFAGHFSAVNSVAFSPDGRSALSGSADKTLKLWDLTASH